jgi:hypothetical protein
MKILCMGSLVIFKPLLMSFGGKHMKRAREEGGKCKRKGSKGKGKKGKEKEKM